MQEGGFVVRSSGFTIVELLVAIAIVAVVAALAFPAAGTFLEGSRLTSTANSYVEAFATARSEAVKRGESVRVIQEETANVGFRVATSAAPETDLAVFPPIPSNVKISFYESGSATDVEFVEYLPTGIRSGGAKAINVFVCNADGSRGRRIDLTASGGTSVTKLDSECPSK